MLERLIPERPGTVTWARANVLKGVPQFLPICDLYSLFGCSQCQWKLTFVSFKVGKLNSTELKPWGFCYV